MEFKCSIMPKKMMLKLTFYSDQSFCSFAGLSSNSAFWLPPFVKRRPSTWIGLCLDLCIVSGVTWRHSGQKGHLGVAHSPFNFPPSTCLVMKKEPSDRNFSYMSIFHKIQQQTLLPVYDSYIGKFWHINSTNISTLVLFCPGVRQKELQHY